MGSILAIQGRHKASDILFEHSRDTKLTDGWVSCACACACDDDLAKITRPARWMDGDQVLIICASVQHVISEIKTDVLLTESLHPNIHILFP